MPTHLISVAAVRVAIAITFALLMLSLGKPEFTERRIEEPPSTTTTVTTKTSSTVVGRVLIRDKDGLCVATGPIEAEAAGVEQDLTCVGEE